MQCLASMTVVDGQGWYELRQPTMEVKGILFKEVTLETGIWPSG